MPDARGYLTDQLFGPVEPRARRLAHARDLERTATLIEQGVLYRYDPSNDTTAWERRTQRLREEDP
jgi:hypothetical protein